MATNFNTANTAGINFGTIYAPPSYASSTASLIPYVEDIGVAKGTVVAGSNNSQYVFCVAGEAISAGMAIAVDEDFTALKLTATLAATGQFIGVAPAASVTSGYYFWAARGGSNVSILVATLCAADISLWTTATAGLLDDASGTAQVQIPGISAVTTNSASISALVEGIIQWPRSATV